MIQTLQNNIETLISAYETQKARAERLSSDFEKLKKQYDGSLEKINELEEKLDSLSLRSVFTGGATDNAEARAKIDELIREIDSALELLQ